MQAATQDKPQEPDDLRTEALASGTSARRFSWQVLWTLSVRLLMAANSVGSGIIISRWLGAESWGVYAVLSVMVGNIVQIGGSGLTSANVYFIARERKVLSTACANAFMFAGVGGSALVFGVLALAAWRPELLPNIPLRLLAVAALAIPFQLLTLLLLNFFLALGRVERYNALDALVQSFVLLNAVLALVLLRAGLSTLVSLNTTASAALSVVIATLVFRAARREGELTKTRLRWRPEAQLFKHMMCYGGKITVMVAAMTLVMRADLLIVHYFRGGVEAGVYAVAVQCSLLLMMLPNVLGTLLFPRVAETRDTSGKFTTRVVRHTAFVMALVSMAAVPLAFVIPIAYGAAFADAPRQLLLLLPGAYLLGLQMILSQYLAGAGVPRALPAFWIFTLLLSVTLNLLLVPHYGARGAACVSTLCYATIFTLTLVYFSSQTGRSFATTLILRRAELERLSEVWQRIRTWF